MAEAIRARACETGCMTMPNAASATTNATAPLRWGVHALVAVSIGLVSPFTGFAWPFAILVGMALGGDDARQMRGESRDLLGGSFRALAVAFGILAMLFFGAIIGGVIAIAVVALTAFSERAAAHASDVDRGVARILVFIVPIAMWLIVFPLLGMDVDIRIGS